MIYSSILAIALSAAASAAMSNPPTQVLAGTDIFEIGDFELIPMPSDLAGRFTAETGGAISHITITPEGDGWRLERSTSEPGKTAAQASYHVERAGNELRDEAGNVQLRVVSDGLLLLEPNAAPATAPNLWRFYAAD